MNVMRLNSEILRRFVVCFSSLCSATFSVPGTPLAALTLALLALLRVRTLTGTASAVAAHEVFSFAGGFVVSGSGGGGGGPVGASL